MRKIANIAFYTILSLILLISLITLYSRIIKKENMVFIGRYGLAVILSGSMEPSLSINDLVIVKKTNEYANGDIVVYDESENLVVHRIVDMTNDNVITKGDANNIEDMPIMNNEIKGKVIKKYSDIGKYILYLSNPVYISLTLIIITMFDMLFKRHA